MTATYQQFAYVFRLKIRLAKKDGRALEWYGIEKEGEWYKSKGENIKQKEHRINGQVRS